MYSVRPNSENHEITVSSLTSFLNDCWIISPLGIGFKPAIERNSLTVNLPKITFYRLGSNTFIFFAISETSSVLPLSFNGLFWKNISPTNEFSV